jgi:hypothetical protein
MTLPSAADITVFFLEGVFLCGSLKKCRLYNGATAGGRALRVHLANTNADIATDAIKNGQPSFAMIG